MELRGKMLKIHVLFDNYKRGGILGDSLHACRDKTVEKLEKTTPQY